ncbi:MAG: FadR family transcriptional regulator [Spirochaetales bacterium]|nr:FadR family transcriptional regulator [Spirochaetales bacterium]
MFKRPAITQLVQEYIRKRIIDEKLKPGDPLPVQGKISEELGVSIGSVREAVKALESLGIVEVRHGNGLFVRGLNLDAVMDVLSFSLIFDPSTLKDFILLRQLWESSLVPDVVKNIKDENINSCKAILVKWAKKVQQDLPDHEEDHAFHQILYSTLNNKLLLKLVDVFWQSFQYAESQLFSSERLNLKIADRRKTLNDHIKILKAIEEKDVKTAQTLLYNHFEGIKKRLSMAEKRDKEGSLSEIGATK